MATSTAIGQALENIIPQSQSGPLVPVHGPYEDALIAWARVMEKLIDGQSPEVKAKLWEGWITFTSPLLTISGKLNGVLEKL